MDSDDEDDFMVTVTAPTKPSTPNFARPTRPASLDVQPLTNPIALGGRLPTPIGNHFFGPKSRPRAPPAPLSLKTPAHLSTKYAGLLQLDQDHWMPSPISEGDFNEPTTPNCTAELQLSRLNVLDGKLVDQGSSSPSLRKGRSRSSAILAPKGRLVMGYREDCEKCRLQIPGHYSHFIPSARPTRNAGTLA